MKRLLRCFPGGQFTLAFYGPPKGFTGLPRASRAGNEFNLGRHRSSTGTSCRLLLLLWDHLRQKKKAQPPLGSLRPCGKGGIFSDRNASPFCLGGMP